MIFFATHLPTSAVASDVHFFYHLWCFNYIKFNLEIIGQVSLPKSLLFKFHVTKSGEGWGGEFQEEGKGIRIPNPATTPPTNTYRREITPLGAPLYKPVAIINEWSQSKNFPKIFPSFHDRNLYRYRISNVAHLVFWHGCLWECPGHMLRTGPKVSLRIFAVVGQSKCPARLVPNLSRYEESACGSHWRRELDLVNAEQG